MKRLGYERVCLLCDRKYLARVATEIYTRMCDDCRTEEKLRMAKIVRRQCIRAMDLGLPATLTLKQWIATLDHFDWKCAYCRISPAEALDHFFPLSSPPSFLCRVRGTTVDNCLPICRTCNSSKQDLHPTIILRGYPSGKQMTIIPNIVEVIRSLDKYLTGRGIEAKKP